ncbi:hypothetical protein [uncultured Thiohalocapsa sp.]|uniref:McrB family protein n=1 Tax=uncultured Thiohalocapsa sp. TaxID=768990 RepID=UPI0025EBCF09|nr:hypothetical protein [uncultured Thiohalocapsa sp.]
MPLIKNPDGSYSKIMEPANIFDYYALNGFQFSNEIITRYATSLLTKPFVILTGISGTGKTKIAQLFADYIHNGLAPTDRENRIAFIPVRPDWMDNKGLLGYHSILDNKYHAPKALRLLLEASRNENKGIPHFIILDEMNLAKVEHYFSDFLSIMETKTSNNPAGEPLTLHNQGNDIFTADGIPIPSKLHIPENVFITGTVNIDESTYMFSPKVLDRANVIEFNDVIFDAANDPTATGTADKRSSRGNFSIQKPQHAQLVQILRATINQQPTSHIRQDSSHGEEVRSIRKEIAAILSILKQYNLHFGYRVIDEILRFATLAEQHVNADDNLATTILDIQLSQKILPKFHGPQAKLEAPLTALLDYAKPAVAETTERQVALPRSAEKLERMLDRLKAQGYADFID